MYLCDGILFKKMENKIDISSPDSIKSRIVKVRGRCVILDSDLAAMYGVETKNLKRTVRMNIERFPEDFMFVQDGILRHRGDDTADRHGRVLPECQISDEKLEIKREKGRKIGRNPTFRPFLRLRDRVTAGVPEQLCRQNMVLSLTASHLKSCCGERPTEKARVFQRAHGRASLQLAKRNLVLARAGIITTRKPVRAEKQNPNQRFRLPFSTARSFFLLSLHIGISHITCCKTGTEAMIEQLHRQEPQQLANYVVYRPL